MRTFNLLFFCTITLTLFAQQPLTCDDEFILTGTAVDQGECIQLTSNSTTQQGCMWFEDPIDFSMPFTHTMAINLGANDGGADGICLVYQSNNNSICGVNGMGIGASGIPNSFIVEFDTYNNGAGSGDIPNDHAAININGDFSNTIDGPIDLGNIEDGANHDVIFDWDPATMTYTISFDGGVILTGVYDIIANCFGGNTMGFWGYTSSTGSLTNIQTVCPGLPPEVLADATGAVTTLEIPCVGATIDLDGSFSDSGPNITYEWTTSDGSIIAGQFTDTPTIDGPGTYTLTVINSDTSCENMDEITITQAMIEADIAIPNYIDCLIGEVTLEGDNSTQGDNITYQWTTTDGNIVSIDEDEAVVDAPGDYTLTVIYDDGVSYCEEETTVTVEEDPDVPYAFAFDADLTCDPPTVELDGGNSSPGNSFEYEWTTDDGIIINGENSLFPLVSAEGTYTLEVTNIFSGCTDEYDIYVTADQELPYAEAQVNDDIGCGSLGVFIDGSQSDFGNNIEYEWTTPNGNIVNGEDTDSPFVDEAGDYYLTVTNTTNGCTDETNVTVMSSDSDVVADIADAEQFTCETESVTLDGSGSIPNANVSYEWSTTDGLILGNNTQSQVSAGMIGTYQLIVTDLTADCADTSSIVVTNNLTPPIAEAGTSAPFQCGDSSLDLDGDGSTSSNATYQWTTIDGQILTNPTTLNPTIGSTGTYYLEVTSGLTDCTAIDSVTVVGDADIPTVQISNNDVLDCGTDSLQLNASMSSNGASFSFTWTSPDGNISSGEQTLMPFVDSGGTYMLSITNSANGCSNSSSILVNQDTITPNISIQPLDSLDCLQTMVTITGTNASATALDYQWTTTNGAIQSGADSLMPIVTSGGNYILTAINPTSECSNTYDVFIFEDQIDPTASALNTELLDCDTPSLVINGSMSTAGNHINYQWTTTDGQFVGATNISSPTINQIGEYQLLVTNTLNQCTDQTSIIIDSSPDNTVANIAPANTLTCIDEVVSLDGINSIPNTDVTYAWSTSDGTIISENDIAEITVNAIGTYQLIVTDLTTGCQDTSSIMVNNDLTEPTSEAGTAEPFHCGDMAQILDGDGSSTVNVSYLWTSPNGQVNSNSNTLTPTVGSAGTYVLQVTNTANGCSAIDSVIVLSDVNLPVVQIALADTLNCTNDSLMLNAMGSSSGSDFSLSWSTPNGSISSGDQTLTPFINAPGTYQLSITNTANDCSNNTFITIIQDTISPDLSILANGIIDCNNPVFTLEASSQTNASLDLQWTSTDGIIDSGANSLEATVSTSGTYQLTAENLENGCLTSRSAAVSIDTIAPVAIIVEPTELNCTDSQVNLDGSSSNGDGSLSYTWSTIDGVFSGIIDAEQAIATAEGMYSLLIVDNDNGCRDSSTVTVIQNAIFPTVNILEPLVLNCDQIAVELEAIASTNSGNMTFLWETTEGNFIADQNTLSPSVNTSGIYTITVEDTDNNCPREASIEVIQDTIPPVAQILDAEELNCELTTVVLSAQVFNNSIPIEYLWSTTTGNIIGSVDQVFASLDTPGEYQLQVQNTNNGCTALANQIITESTTLPIVAIAQADTLTCVRLVVSLDASSNSSQGSEYVYNWQTLMGGSIMNPSSLVASVEEIGEYQLTVLNTDNHCSDSLSIMVAGDYTQPLVEIAEPDSLDCDTDTVSLLANSPGNNNVAFSWTIVSGNITMGADTDNPTVSQVGVYMVEITDQNNGCSQSDTIEVYQDDALPVVSIALPEVLNCDIEELILDASQSSTDGSYLYTWTTDVGQIVSGTDSLIPLISESGTYTLTILDQLNGCDHTNFVTVTQDIVIPIANAGADTELNCASEVAQLNGLSSSQNGPYTYLWTSDTSNIINDETSLSPSIYDTGIFRLDILNTENGCRDFDEVLVFQNIPSATVEFDEPKCYGETGYINITDIQGGSPPFQYSVDGGQTFQSQGFFTLLPAGQYDVIIDDANNCIFENSIEITQPDSLTVQITEPQIELNFGDSITLITQSNFSEESLNIQWQHDGGLACDSCLVSLAKPLESTQYIIRVSTEDGCRDESIVRFIVRKDRPVYIPTAFSPNGDSDNDLFYIFARDGAVKEIRSLQIFSRWGQPLYSADHFQPNDPSYGWDGHHAGLPLNAGVFVYVAEIEFSDGGVEIFKGDVMVIR